MAHAWKPSAKRATQVGMKTTGGERRVSQNHSHKQDNKKDKEQKYCQSKPPGVGSGYILGIDVLGTTPM